jgi:tRNA-Thr(GGU) m(6)t(6)A37 methyltransferase TsaA
MNAPSLPPELLQLAELTVPLVAIGWVRSPYTPGAPVPHQAREGAVSARLHFAPALHAGLADARVGEEFIVLTWLDRAPRSVLQTRPQDNPALPLRGVFATRSPGRPNPIGLHRVRVVAMTSPVEWQVDRLEVFDGTPILDVKPVLPWLADA